MGGRKWAAGAAAVGVVAVSLVSATGSPASAASGPGTMVVTPQQVLASSTGNTLSFTYTAATAGIRRGELKLTIPKGWSASQQKNPGLPGFVTANAGTLKVTRFSVMLADLTVCGGCRVIMTYADATAPAGAMTSTFTTSVAASGKKTKPVASEPVVAVVTSLTVPGQPTIFSIGVGDRELLVNFSPASTNGSPVISYTAACGVQSTTVQGDPGVAVVTGLTNGTTYSCTVYATNSVGRGEQSSAVSGTPEVVVPGIPSVTDVIPGSGSLTVDYDAAPSFGAVITGYTAVCGSITTTVGGSTLSITVNGLTVDGQYSCTLYATDSAGNGPNADWGGQAGPPDAPTISSVLSQDRQLTVQYNTSVGTSISGFTATCGNRFVTVNGSTAWATVTGLTNGVTYSCTVLATNAAGHGPASTAFMGTPDPIASSPTASAGGVFIGVSCPSTTICVAVGAAGTSDATGLVERSSDGGQTFTDEPVPVGTPKLNAVTCFDTTHCLAVGGSVVLVTTDGGTTWTSEFAEKNLATVTCLSLTLCLAGGWNGGSGGGGVAVTSDGGTTWQESLTASVYSISCTASACIGVGPVFVASADQGASWRAFGVPGGVFGDLTSVACLPGTTTCIMVGENGQGIGHPTAPAEAFITTDNGGSWANISSSFPSGTFPMEDIACPTSTTCFAVGFPLTNGGPLVGATTADGGKTWTSISGPTGMTPASLNETDGFGFQNLSCGSTSMCVVVGNDSTGPEAAYTTNGASSWTLATSIG